MHLQLSNEIFHFVLRTYHYFLILFLYKFAKCSIQHHLVEFIVHIITGLFCFLSGSIEILDIVSEDMISVELDCAVNKYLASRITFNRCDKRIAIQRDRFSVSGVKHLN